MIKTRAPLRVSFAGGGTDIEPYVSQYGGCAISGAIKLYCKAFYPLKRGNRTEMEKTITEFLGADKALEIINGTEPMSGLGGSASCFVAGIKAVCPELEREEIAKLAFYLERNIMGIAGGKQDQYCASYGGLLFLEFKDNGAKVEKLEIPETLARHLILVYMGKRHNNGQDIIKDQMNRFYVRNFHLQKQIARQMKECLRENNLLEFGELLDEAWQVKLGYSPLIANTKIKAFYNNCMEWGAIGGKLTGAGGGGYMLLMEHPERNNDLRASLSDRLIPYLDVYFDTEGVKVL